ncbi:MAG: hypothetical protein HZB80_01910 [Deltaproteobacteria bacterium]|nr:hypothetical protein [Deltaproteobacteria bacterium]
MKRIIFTIKDGKINTSLNGFHGSDCIVEAQRIIEALSKAGIALDCKELVRKDNYEKETVKACEKDTTN